MVALTYSNGGCPALSECATKAVYAMISMKQSDIRMALAPSHRHKFDLQIFGSCIPI